MPELPDIIDHTVLQPGEWLIIRVDPEQTLSHLEAMAAVIPAELRDRTLFVSEGFEVSPTTWLWCEHHEMFGRTDPEWLRGDGNPLWCGADGSATCPGKHRRALIGSDIKWRE